MRNGFRNRFQDTYVVPAKAGIHFRSSKSKWIPAFAGMTIWMVQRAMDSRFRGNDDLGVQRVMDSRSVTKTSGNDGSSCDLLHALSRDCLVFFMRFTSSAFPRVTKSSTPTSFAFGGGKIKLHRMRAALDR